MTGIERTWDSDYAKKSYNGFVKVCATWVQTMWDIEPEMDPTKVLEYKGLS